MRSSLDQTDHRPLLTVVEGGDRVPAGQQDLCDLAGGRAESSHHVQSHLAAAGVNTLQAEQQAGHRLGVGDDVVLEQLVELVQPGQGVSVSLALLPHLLVRTHRLIISSNTNCLGVTECWARLWIYSTTTLSRKLSDTSVIQIPSTDGKCFIRM